MTGVGSSSNNSNEPCAQRRMFPLCGLVAHVYMRGPQAEVSGEFWSWCVL